MPDTLFGLLSFPHFWPGVIAALFDEPFVVRELIPIFNICCLIELAFPSDRLSEIMVELRLLVGALLGRVAVFHQVS